MMKVPIHDIKNSVVVVRATDELEAEVQEEITSAKEKKKKSMKDLLSKKNENT